jgi:hypothetical protein
LKVMMGLARRIGAAVAVLAVWAAGPAAAQENLDKGKTPAQLYASDCAICHKSPNGLAKRLGPYGLDNFLREHYTASRESAAAISAYLRTIDRQPAPKRERSSKRKAKASEPKLPPRKPVEAKSSDTKASKTKASSAKPSDAKPSDAKPSESKTKASAEKHEEATSPSPKAGEAKASEPKPAAAQPAEAKAEAPKASPPKPAKDTEHPKPDKSD